jgi:hypothetical protein
MTPSSCGLVSWGDGLTFVGPGRVEDGELLAQVLIVHVTVQVSCDADARMGQHLGDDLERDLEGEHDAGRAVAEVVETSMVETCLTEPHGEAFADMVAVQGLAGGPREYQLNLAPVMFEDAPLCPGGITLALLPEAVLTQRHGNRGRQRQTARRSLRA